MVCGRRRDHDWDLLELKERYNTASHELIARRMLEMRPPIVITVCDQGRVHWRRSNVTSRPPEMLAEETRRLARLRIERACRRVNRSMAKQDWNRVRCWPVHEPGWKREIMPERDCGVLTSMRRARRELGACVLDSYGDCDAILQRISNRR